MAWNDNPGSGRGGWNQPPQWGRQQPRRDSWGAPPPPRYPQQPPQSGWGRPPQDAPRYGEGRRLPNMNYDLGTKCRVKTAKDNIVVTIIKVGREQYEVRMPDLTVGWFYEHELEPINE